MRKVNYRPGKLLLSAIVSLLVAAWFGVGWTPENSVLWLMAAAIFAYFAFASLRTAIGDRPALAYDERGITINSLHRSGRYSWYEIGDLLIERMAVRYFGIIPGSNKDFLCVRIDRANGTGRLYRINARLVELPTGGLVALHGQLAAARLAAVANGANALATQSVEGGEGSVFDPDAAIARYLAAKQASAPAAETSPAPTFRTAPRPTFGRRIG